MKPTTILAVASSLLALLFGGVPTIAQEDAATEKATVASEIPGVVAAGTKVERIWTGSQSADGIVGGPDGSLIFTEQQASRVNKIDKNGKVSVLVEDANGAGALAFDYKGRMIAIERLKPRVEMLTPTRKVLVDTTEGKPIEMVADLVVDKKGGLYFTETRMPPRKSVTYYIKPGGEVVPATDDAARGNGVMLSPDEKVLYITSGQGEDLFVFDVQPDGSLKNRRTIPVGKGADGLAVDSTGRLYIASQAGVQVLSPEGKLLGTIPTPRSTTSVAFAGPDKKTLYVTARGFAGPGGDAQWARSMYKIAMVAQGYKDRAK